MHARKGDSQPGTCGGFQQRNTEAEILLVFRANRLGFVKQNGLWLKIGYAPCRGRDHLRTWSSNRPISAKDPHLIITRFKKNIHPPSFGGLVENPYLMRVQSWCCVCRKRAHFAIICNITPEIAQLNPYDCEVRTRYSDLYIIVRARLFAMPKIKCPTTGDAPWSSYACKHFRHLVRPPGFPGISPRDGVLRLVLVIPHAPKLTDPAVIFDRCDAHSDSVAGPVRDMRPPRDSAFFAALRLRRPAGAGNSKNINCREMRFRRQTVPQIDGETDIPGPQ
jgi:hypothetical protein